MQQWMDWWNRLPLASHVQYRVEACKVTRNFYETSLPEPKLKTRQYTELN